jgi:hypothetical protein
VFKFYTFQFVELFENSFRDCLRLRLRNKIFKSKKRFFGNFKLFLIIKSAFNFFYTKYVLFFKRIFLSIKRIFGPFKRIPKYTVSNSDIFLKNKI